MLSMTMEYALRAAVFLAERTGGSCTVQEIAQETQVPTDYLSKVMRSLCRASLVKSRPGRHGGYELQSDPSALTLFDVFQAVEPIREIVHCPLNKPCHAKNLCSLHSALNCAAKSFAASLQSTTLASLCGAKNSPEVLAANLALAPGNATGAGR